jgi:hypothetical protein
MTETNDHEISFLSAIWKGARPSCVANGIDAVRTISFLLMMLSAHVVQLLVLKVDWSPWFVHYLDLVEEVLAFCSLSVFLLMSAFSFAWGTFRRFQTEAQ